VVAYDLNKGTIKWKEPLGQDAAAEAEGGKIPEPLWLSITE
jgi:hypothetical protein